VHNPLGHINDYHERTPNHCIRLKARLRRDLLALTDSPRVADLYAGAGVMARTCYEGLPYIGIDRDRGQTAEEWAATADVTAWNFFDLDAYGSALPVVETLAARVTLPATFVLTDGTRLHVQMRSRLPEYHQRFVPGGDRYRRAWYSEYAGILRSIVEALFAGRRVVDYQQRHASRHGVTPLYVGFRVVEGGA